MHPVKLDELLSIVPQPYEPTKHADSPYCLLEEKDNLRIFHAEVSGEYRKAERRNATWNGFIVSAFKCDHEWLKLELHAWRKHNAK